MPWLKLTREACGFGREEGPPPSYQLVWFRLSWWRGPLEALVEKMRRSLGAAREELTVMTKARGGLTTGEVLGLVNRAVDTAGGASEVARRIGVSKQFVSDMLNGNKRMNERLLRFAGVERIETITYHLIEPAGERDAG